MRKYIKPEWVDKILGQGIWFYTKFLLIKVIIVVEVNCPLSEAWVYLLSQGATSHLVLITVRSGLFSQVLD